MVPTSPTIYVGVDRMTRSYYPIGIDGHHTYEHPFSDRHTCRCTYYSTQFVVILLGRSSCLLGHLFIYRLFF